MKKTIRPVYRPDPYNVCFGVAFGAVPKTDNFFVVLVAGSRAGQIFYTQGDGGSVSLFSKSFEGFIKRITSNPIKLLTKDLHGCASFQDVQTFESWIPFEVVRSSCCELQEKR